MLTRRGAATVRRAHQVTSDSIRFGRGTDNEVVLPDIRVGLSAAVLHRRPEGLFIEQVGDTPLRHNGSTIRVAQLNPGDVIQIGPYEIALSAPPEGLDAAFSVELVQPMGDAMQRLTRQSRIGLERTHLSKRRASWALFLALIALCIAAPIIAYEYGGKARSPTVVASGGGAAGVSRASWNPGELSNQHRYFAKDCGTCHQSAFTEVKDSACMTCHSGIGNHIAQTGGSGLEQVRARLQQSRCADCHVEHRGINSLVIREGALCIDCHRSLAETAPKAGILDVGDFPQNHPQFRATVVANPVAPTFTKVSLEGTLQPADHPGLHFSHAAHLVPQGFPVLGYKPLGCADCHKPEPSGQGFQPITFKADCQRCHYENLTVDAILPGKVLPHGDDKGVANMVEGFYASLVVERGVPQSQNSAVERRLPGAAASAPLPQDARAWVKQKTREALAIIYDPKRGCFECHLPDSSKGPFRVAPVVMRTRFFPAARFDHAKHAAVSCDDCHAARQARSSADVLIPGKERCVTCHGTENASFRAQSTCLTCHIFHRQDLGPMRKTVGLPAAGAREADLALPTATTGAKP
ncbi:MAG TPA: cytochrome c3 family protein [Stellaceae bacterium]|nr:cytochrome c3 family protein [Stellaceae bacterium]